MDQMGYYTEPGKEASVLTTSHLFMRSSEWDFVVGNFQVQLERVTGIEPAFQAWEACVLPLNYTRRDLTLCPIVSSLRTIAPIACSSSL